MHEDVQCLYLQDITGDQCFEYCQSYSGYVIMLSLPRLFMVYSHILIKRLLLVVLSQYSRFRNLKCYILDSTVQCMGATALCQDLQDHSGGKADSNFRRVVPI